MKITIDLDDVTTRRLKDYQRKVVEHRKGDLKYSWDDDYALEEAGAVLLRYGLDFVATMSPEEEEKIGIPPGFETLAVGPKAR